MRTRTRETEGGASTSLLDLCCCGLGGLVILMMLLVPQAVDVHSEHPEPFTVLVELTIPPLDTSDHALELIEVRINGFGQSAAFEFLISGDSNDQSGEEHQAAGDVSCQLTYLETNGVGRAALEVSMPSANSGELELVAYLQFKGESDCGKVQLWSYFVSQWQDDFNMEHMDEEHASCVHARVQAPPPAKLRELRTLLRMTQGDSEPSVQWFGDTGGKSYFVEWDGGLIGRWWLRDLRSPNGHRAAPPNAHLAYEVVAKVRPGKEGDEAVFQVDEVRIRPVSQRAR